MRKLILFMAATVFLSSLCSCGTSEVGNDQAGDSATFELVTSENDFSLSVYNRENYRWVQYGDGIQYSIPSNEELIFIQYNGKYLSVGNAVLCNEQLYVPYTVLTALGMTQEITNHGFGTMSFSKDGVKVRIPWSSEYYTIEKGSQPSEYKREVLYHNDILYIPIDILEYLSYSISFSDGFPNHDNYATIMISDEDRIPNITIEQAKEALFINIKEIYDEEIARNESDLTKGQTIYSPDAFEKMKDDSGRFSIDYVETYGDYYVFNFNNTAVNIYVNMYSGETYYDDCYATPNLLIVNGFIDIADVYY